VAWPVTADVDSFDAALEWFRTRVPEAVDGTDLTDLAGRRHAFRVAGVTELEVLQALHDEISKAIEEGKPIGQFRKDVRARLKDWNVDGHKLDTIFITNVQTAYNTGRYTQMTKPEITDVRPFLMFDAVLDGGTTEICRVRDGVIKRHDDPYVRENWPTLHHR
jgi:SPP1 gp7 family putative phage head morphogenesis protein